MSGDKVTVKTEASSTFKRLPSFKQPRDLKLSQFSNPLAEARTKKVFVPNLNVQRKKQNDSHEGSAESSNERRDKNKREERQRQKKTFIQGQSIFSEGLAPQMKRFSSGGRYNQDSSSGGGGGGSGGGILKPKLKLNEPIKVDPNEEDLIMKELMRDDFIDDPGTQPDMDDSPVNLPLRKLKKEPVPQPMVCEDVKPIDITKLRTYTAAEIIHNQAQDNNFVFFQIPNSIPRLKVPEVAKTSKNKSTSKEEEEEGAERCSLRSLPSGQIGTLQILRSGRARLLLGDVKLMIESGTQVAFQKELVSVDLNSNEKTGNIIHVGNLTTRILVTPDWENLIKTNKTT
ncbi:DNA-directed RNA polymerase III subunit RPC4 isoform X2 [Halyomorpha halys]|uniref:DNA-directed RNA polymerase III subunit RPC4 isoform X2 n=1 Tax=Halyomorpha halys TaxID=286706 RepID=UPI0006D4FF8B|nr:DNA-directed RNA polymerase III subunit RPC4 isoform X2 [Halyomorpha halys]